ncbi:MAG TPA: protealysin inhibitor emfourin [Nitrososphaeraceae archaeon]|nr:protealysin inhibitor emfourin [Nitrososphaeraceae archaeon]
MKIHFERSGGFAGIRTTFTVDSNSLSFDEKDRLRNIIDNSKFFDLPSETPLPRRGADYFKYKITIESADPIKSHTIETNDMTMPSELRPLVNYLKDKTKSKH